MNQQHKQRKIRQKINDKKLVLLYVKTAIIVFI